MSDSDDEMKKDIKAIREFLIPEDTGGYSIPRRPTTTIGVFYHLIFWIGMFFIGYVIAFHMDTGPEKYRGTMTSPNGVVGALFIWPSFIGIPITSIWLLKRIIFGPRL